MAGTAYLASRMVVTDLGSAQPMSTDFTVTSIDEISYQYQELATVTAVAIDVGQINEVNAIFIKLITGGTTKALGLDIDLSTATFAAADMTLVQGQAIVILPIADATTFSVYNNSTATCVFEYAVVGQNS